MAILYDYYPNPPKSGEEKTTIALHPRPVITGTLNTERLVTYISDISSFSAADVKGMLENLAYYIYSGLSESENVYLEGIGTFYISLESRPVTDIKEIRSPSIQVKDIHFRPDKALLNKVKRSTIQRVKKPRKPARLTQEERFERILWYIRRYQHINITTAMHLNQCNHKKANKDIEQMIAEKRIQKTHVGRLAFYRMVD